MTGDSPWILGIASSHNGGACLMHGQNIVVAIQEERLLRHKRAEHPGAFPSLSIEYCLRRGGISPRELDAVVLCAALSNQSKWESVVLNPQLETVRNGSRVFTIPHHLGHAVAAYAMSGKTSAGIMIVDGNGSPWDELLDAEKDVTIEEQKDLLNRSDRTEPRENISMYIADRGIITPIEKHIASYPRATSKTPGMPEFQTLGDMYGSVGKQIFGSFLEGPGKVMGLAPFGRPTIPVEEFYRKTPKSFEFQDLVRRRFGHDEHWPLHRDEYHDLAASVQRALEDAVLNLARRLRPQSDNLCYAGGVALNSVANERIVRESGFRSVYIMPAAEDSGTAFGAAYYGLWQLCGYQPTKEQRVDAFGCSYSNEEIGASIQRFPGVRTVKVPDVVERAVDLLADGKIVGWFQDGAEMGPRSLGQRSILCDPRRAEMKQMLNRKVKFREEFRPFAPMLPEEAVYDWFDVTPPHGISPFMLRVLDFREEQGSKVPAVVHVDGTGRVQTVSADASPTLHRLLTTFGRKTGVPILLNTSFNVAGEPIVETPADALWCFLHTGVDCCILGDHVVTKLEGVSAALDYPLQITADSVVLQGHVVNGSARFDIPTLRDADSHGYSAHLSRPEPMEGFRHTGKAPLSLRLVVTTDWGRVAHWVPGALIRILRLIDGRRTGREIYEELVADGSYAGDCSAGGTTISADSDSVVPSTRFHQHLGLLRRVGAIGFQSQPGRTDSRTRVQKVAVVSQEIAAPDTTYRSEEFLS